jgi:UDP-perosamine 4-acetyltransferase
MKKIMIIGGGGHAKVLIDMILSTSGFEIQGILDPKLKIGSHVSGVAVLGGDEFLKDFKDIAIAIGVGSTRASDTRKVIFEKYRDKFEFPVIVHKNAYISKTSTIGIGTQVMAGAIIQPDAFIKENVIINTSAVIEHDCRIHAHSHISPGAILGGNVEIGECSHVGLGAMILQGVRIGKNVTVGAGAVVVRDVKDGLTVKGVPAR